MSCVAVGEPTVLCRLRSLELRGNAIGDGTTPHHTPAGGRITLHPCTALVCGSAHRPCSRASPGVFVAPAGGASALAEALLGERRRGALEELRLADNGIWAAGARSLALALKEDRTLTHLHLGGNTIGSGGVEALLKAVSGHGATRRPRR